MNHPLWALPGQNLVQSKLFHRSNFQSIWKLSVCVCVWLSSWSWLSKSLKIFGVQLFSKTHTTDKISKNIFPFVKQNYFKLENKKKPVSLSKSIRQKGGREHTYAKSSWEEAWAKKRSFNSLIKCFLLLYL